MEGNSASTSTSQTASSRRLRNFFPDFRALDVLMYYGQVLGQHEKFYHAARFLLHAQLNKLLNADNETSLQAALISQHHFIAAINEFIKAYERGITIYLDKGEILKQPGFFVALDADEKAQLAKHLNACLSFDTQALDNIVTKLETEQSEYIIEGINEESCAPDALSNYPLLLAARLLGNASLASSLVDRDDCTETPLVHSETQRTKNPLHLHLIYHKINHPLNLALELNHLSRAKLLVEKKHPLNLICFDGRNAWHLAAQSGNPLAVDRLKSTTLDKKLANKITVKGQSVFHFSAQSSNSDSLLNSLASLVSDGEFAKLIELTDCLGRTALHYAAIANNEKALGWLITSGLSGAVNDSDGLGRTPLHYAVEHKHLAAATVLVSNDADSTLVDLPDKLYPRERVTEFLNQLKFDLRQALPDEKAPIDSSIKQLKKLESLLKDVPQSQATKALFLSIKKGDQNKMWAAIDKGADLFSRNVFSNTPIHEAIYQTTISDNDVIKLHKRMGNENPKGYLGKTLLLWSAERGCSQLFKYFDELFWTQDDRDASGNTVYHALAKSGLTEWLAKKLKGVENIKELLSIQNRQGETPLHLALLGSHLSTVKKLVELLPEQVKAISTKQCRTVLHKVCLGKDNANILRYLLANDADPKALDYLKRTPLHLCALYGDLDMLAILLSKHGNVEKGDSFGQTPLMLAIEANQPSLVSKLLQNGSNITQYNDYHRNVMHIAAMHANEETLNELRKHNINSLITSLDDKQRTPLHLAAREGNVTMAKYLVGRGASLDEKDIQGKTPYQVAQSHDRTPGAKDVANYLRAEFNKRHSKRRAIPRHQGFYSARNRTPKNAQELDWSRRVTKS